MIMRIDYESEIVWDVTDDWAAQIDRINIVQ